MKSSSSLLARGGLSEEIGSFARWTPEPLEAAAPVRQIPTSPRAAMEAAVEEVEARAREREAELLARLEAERDEAVQEAYERGYEEGRDQGERGEAARLRTAVECAREALDELRAGEVRWSGTIEENICALATVIARQVLGRELALDMEPVADLVRSALKEFPIDQPLRIRINPADLAVIASVGGVEANPLKAISADREARWVGDVSIAPGGCIVEGRERIIDGRIDTALERVYRRLTYTNA